VRDLETSTMRRPRPELDCCAVHARTHTVTHSCLLLLSLVQISVLGFFTLGLFATVFTPQSIEVSYIFLPLRTSSLFTVSFDAASTSNDPTRPHFLPISCSLGGRDSAVGTATRYGLDGKGDRIPLVARFAAPVQTTLGAHLAS
jgi:hypothetical protein